MANVRVSSRVKREKDTERVCVSERVMMRRPIGRFKAAQCSD